MVVVVGVRIAHAVFAVLALYSSGPHIKNGVRWPHSTFFFELITDLVLLSPIETLRW